MAVQSQFNKLLSDIEPSSTTKTNASRAHTDLRDFLANHETYKQVYQRSFLSGSYKRNTAIRPRVKNGVADRADIDTIVVTNYTRADDPETVIDELYKVLKEEYDSYRKQGRSVGVSTNLADMDAVPVIEETFLFDSLAIYVPDRHRKEWVRTNPEGHTTWTTDKNKETGERFKPLVKLVKWWRRENPWWAANATSPKRKPKGFQIECIIAENMDDAETQWAELFVSTLEAIEAKYALTASLGSVPYIQDPAVPTNDVMAGVEAEVFKRFYDKASEHAILGREASDLEEDDPDGALERWRKIFGPRFPSASVAKAQAEATNVTPAVVPSFPNHKVVPDKGPKGFA